MISGLRALLEGWQEPSRRKAAFVLLVSVVSVVGYASVLGRSYPLGDWLFWKIAAIWAWALLLGAACVSVGHAVIARVLPIEQLPTLEVLVHSAAAGLLVFVLGMYVGGFLHRYDATFAVVLPVAMLAAGARPTFAFVRARFAARRAEGPPRSTVDRAMARLAAAFGLVGLLLLYLGAMTPEAINFDASWSHLPIASDYARAGRIVPFDGDYTRSFPHLASLVHTWPMIVPSWGVLTEPPLRWMLAQHLEILFFLWTLAGVAAMVAWLLERDRVRSAWAAFFLFPAIFVYDSNLGGAADHYLAFFAPPLFLAAMRCAPRFGPRACALVGAYAAGALLTKYQAVYLLAGVGAVACGLWLAAVTRALRRDEATPSLRQLVVGPAAMLLTFAVVTSPHFLKNWVFYGNPMYPFLQDVFASRPTTPRAAYLFEELFKDARYRPHGTLLQNLGDAVRLTFTWSLQPHYSFTREVPAAGALFTLCMPMALVVRAPRRIGLGYAAGMGALFAWAMIFRVDRHLQTFMPLLVAVTAAVLVRAWELGWIARAGLALLVGLQIVWGGDAPFYSSHARIRSSVDLIRSGFERRAGERFRGYWADNRAMGAALPVDAKVLLHMLRPNLGLDRETVLDWAGQQGLLVYDDVHGPRSLYELYRSLGVTHLLWIPGWQVASTKQQDVVFSDFVHRYGVSVGRFGTQELVALPPQPPPPDHPYLVLALGLPAYADGLYSLEAMNRYEAIQGGVGAAARPSVPLPLEPAAQIELATRADAVCLADWVHADPLLQRQIDALFEVVTSYAGAGAFSVRVRARAR